jgi:hypothetical protein
MNAETLTLIRAVDIQSVYLVFGKPAKIRHCPATVNAENSRSNTTGLTPARAGFFANRPGRYLELEDA